MSDPFYFIAFVGTDDTTITVIDLARCVDYEREDWRAIDDINYGNPQDAIAYARKVAEVNKLTYRPFESRYDSSTSEPRVSLILPPHE